LENPVHLLFLGAVALVVLGPKRLPELARAAGKSHEWCGRRHAERGGRSARARPAAALSGLFGAVAAALSGLFGAVAVALSGLFGAVAAALDGGPAQAIRSRDAPDRRPL
jgi:hypothetical protein